MHVSFLIIIESQRSVCEMRQAVRYNYSEFKVVTIVEIAIVLS